MGLDAVRHRGLGRSCTLLTVTPIDGEFVDARYTFFVQTDQETGEMTRMGLGFARDFCKQIEQDIPIWENKIYRDRPQLARGEGEFPWAERRQGLSGEAHVRRAPVGVVGAIVPWNVPQFLIMPKLIPALIAGCTVVVKPAPETPLDAMWLAEMLDEIGLPEGVVSIIPGGRETGEALVRHPEVDKISFTGSSSTGRHIAALCGSSSSG
jgi:acyl-CoA reductase-like NAD-dependent aldehyde dehydrogenase